MRKSFTAGTVILVIYFLNLFLQPLFVLKANAEFSFCSAQKITIDPNNDFLITVSIGQIPDPIGVYKMVTSDQTSIGSVVNGDMTFQFSKMPPGDYPFTLFVRTAVYSERNCKEPPILRIPDVGQGGITSSANIKFSPPNPTSNNAIKATVSNLPQDGEYTLSLYNPGPPDQSAEQPIQCEQSQNKEVVFSIEPITTGGIRNVSVYRRDPQRTNECGSLSGIIADGQITISSPVILPSPTSPSPPCAEYDDARERCIAVDTAIGKISTEPQELIRSIFSMVLGLAGGISLILIIISGYRIMASSGNPEALAAGRQQLISAIVGLLFIIFSFVILEVIGVDILRIPGFQP